MRSLIFTLATLCISGMALAQVAIKAGTVLTYKVNEYDGPVDQTVTINTLSPDVKISWAKKNKYDDKGTLIVKSQAKESAINLIFNFPINSNDDELTDVLLGFMVSKKTFTELKTAKKTKIRIDCQLKSEELTFKSIQPMNITVGGKTQTVNCINASWGTYGDEMWILDNADFPIIIKVSAISKFELTEIK